MNQWNIRAVAPGDAAFLTKLMNDPSLLARLHQEPSEENDWKDAIALWLSDADEEGYIISYYGQDIGWVAVNGLLSPEKLPYIKIAVLLPAFQNRGLGKQIIGHLLKELRKRAYPAVRLFADQDNPGARKCYASCGFQAVGSAHQDWPDGTTCMQVEMEVRWNS